MKEFVNDYKILLVEARKNDLTFHLCLMKLQEKMKQKEKQRALLKRDLILDFPKVIFWSDYKRK